jgi:hypothetical protein
MTRKAAFPLLLQPQYKASFIREGSDPWSHSLPPHCQTPVQARNETSCRVVISVQVHCQNEAVAAKAIDERAALK